MTIDRSSLERLHDFAASEATVVATLAAAGQSDASVLRFLYRYAHWNGYFGCGVATLSGQIGRSRGLFVDASQPYPELADRSVLVASYFFDAARDEFDDRDTAHRDTHRDLAQAMVLGTIASLVDAGLPDPSVRTELRLPVWLEALGHRVAAGYGNGTADVAPVLFRAMGYHLGSEVLADQEFTLLDRGLKEVRPDLVASLSSRTVRIGEIDHNAYAWIRIHSGGGGAVEADHFEWAVRGVNRAFAYTPPAAREAMVNQVHRGFMDFAADHEEFFASVNLPTP